MLYLCIAMYALLAMFPLMDSNPPMDAMQVLSSGHSNGLHFLMTTVIPALTYAVVYVDDYDTRLLYVWVARSGQKAYALSYFATALISAFAVSFVGDVMCLVGCAMRGLPIIVFNEAIGRYSGTFTVYDMLLAYNHTGLFVLVVLTEFALGATVMAGLAAAFSTLTHRRLMTLCLPIFYFFLWSMVFTIAKNFPELNLKLHPMLNIEHLAWVSEYFRETWPLANFLYKLLTCAIHWVTFGLITVWQIERSVKNA
jgi:hypothetical protein